MQPVAPKPASTPLKPVYQPVKAVPQRVATPSAHVKSEPQKQGPRVGEQFISGAAYVAGEALSVTGKVIKWSVNTAIATLLPEDKVADNYFEKRVIEVSGRCPKIVKKLEAGLKESKEELDLMLAIINSTPADGNHKKGDQSLTNIEKFLNHKESELSKIKEDFKKLLAEEKKKFS
jgi:hypothetical protein